MTTAQEPTAGPPLRAGRRATRLADDVAQVLHDMILDGELGPGTPLLQIQLAERLGVSRTPLREAFRMLEREGLLRISNGNNTVEVTRLEPCLLVETYQVREVLDGLSARLAAERGLTEAEVAELAGALDRMEAASGAFPSIGDYSTAHCEFHLGILRMSGNVRLLESAPLVRFSSKMLLTRYVRQHVRNPQPLIREAVAVGNREHRQIFEALRSGDPAAAERAAVCHIRHTTGFAKRLAAGGPGLPDGPWPQAPFTRRNATS